MMTVNFAVNGRLTLSVEPGRKVFLYIVRGEFDIGGQRVQPRHLVELHDDGDAVTLTAICRPAASAPQQWRQCLCKAKGLVWRDAHSGAEIVYSCI